MSWPTRIGTIAQRATAAASNKLSVAGWNWFGELANNQSYMRENASVDRVFTTGSIWVSGSSNSGRWWNGMINTNKRYYVRYDAQRTLPQLQNLARVGTGSNWFKAASYELYHYAIDAVNKHIWYNSNALSLGNFTKIRSDTFSDIRCGGDLNVFNPCLLALKTDNTLWSYGSNTYGELGDNTTVGRNSFAQIGANTWTSFDITLHSLAVRSDGTLWGWGYGANGRIGNNAVVNRSSPVQIGTGTTWRQVSCGDSFSGAVKTDNTLWMWGYNGYGQLGQNNTTDRSSPVQVGTGTDWSAVMCGRLYNTFALKTNGTLWAWGANCVPSNDGFPPNVAQLGTGDYINRSSPVQIGTGSNWTKNVFSAQGGQFAINTSKQLWMWGPSYQGTAGGNNYTASSNTIKVDTTSNFVKVLSSTNTNQIYGPAYAPVVGLKSNGTLWNWGGLIGAGSVAPSSERKYRSSPVQIGTGSNWTSNFSLWSPLFANFGDTEVSCMFINSSGQLWRISSDIRRITTGSNWTTVVSMGNPSNQTNGGYMCLQSNGTRWGYYGFNVYGDMGIGSTASVGSGGSPARLDTATNWSNLFTGYFCSFGIRTNGTLWSWGRNDSGQLGLGDKIDRSSPVQVGTGTDWRLVSCMTAFPTYTLAIKTNGTLWAWGANDQGRLGDGTTTYRSSPVQIGTGTNWVSASAGVHGISFALKSDGTLWGWGNSNNFGLYYPQSLRGAYSSSPVQVGALNTWKDVTQGAFQTFLLGTT